MRKYLLLLICSAILVHLGCPGETAPADDDDDSGDPAEEPMADVEAVSATGDPGAYTFAVTVRSPDTSCDQYADWWEVLTEEGELVFRRILTHSHPDEQPFTRTGDPVPVQPGDVVIVRAHLSTRGYGGAAMRGSAAAGWQPAPDITADFAADVETQDPQPDDCLF